MRRAVENYPNRKPDRVTIPDEKTECIVGFSVEAIVEALGGTLDPLLVANSHGINVWCASAGGHLTTHDVISSLKTSGVADKVTHRRVILPQLAATGLEADEVRERTGWRVIWGPVYAKDLPAFMQGDETARMRQVRFDPLQRLEMAVMWAAPLSLLALVTLLFWPAGLLPLFGLIWGLPLTVYMAFPLYQRLLSQGGFVGFTALFGGLVLAETGRGEIASGQKSH